MIPRHIPEKRSWEHQGRRASFPYGRRATYEYGKVELPLERVIATPTRRLERLGLKPISYNKDGTSWIRLPHQVFYSDYYSRRTIFSSRLPCTAVITRIPATRGSSSPLIRIHEVRASWHSGRIAKTYHKGYLENSKCFTSIPSECIGEVQIHTAIVPTTILGRLDIINQTWTYAHTQKPNLHS